MENNTKQQFQNVLSKLEKGDKKGVTKEQMYTAASVAPVTGDVIAIKELPEDVKQIKTLFEEGYRESDFKKLGMGALYTTAVTAGLIPVAGVVGRTAKSFLKPVIKKASDEMSSIFKTASGDVNTQPSVVNNAPTINKSVSNEVPSSSFTATIKKDANEKKKYSKTTQELLNRKENTANLMKPLFNLDEDYAKNVGGEIKVGMTGKEPVQLSNSQLKKTKKEIYSLTQELLKDLPDELTVYRYGKLNSEDGISSFTLNPKYDVKDLPWQKRLQDSLQVYRVNKSEVLASPDINSFFGGGRKFDEDELIINNKSLKLVIEGNNKKRNLAKGGTAMSMKQQMEMFEDGGLRDEGGMVDEESGNDVPTGSTREEVRDDIPAQLSEGEFVLPADVVRFHGLAKIMALRDEAKAGLAKMEDMGQMGNSEEATLSDETPFSLEDLDMEDDTPFSMEDLDMKDESQEMAEGGYVMVAGKPMPIPMIGGQLAPITTRPMPETKDMAVGGFLNPTGTYQIPTNIASQPSYFQNYAQSTAPFSPFSQPTQQTGVPTSPVVGQTGQQGPTFNELMPQLTGKRETKEYRNAAGQKLFIPFINDEPIYPIPEGYILYVAEAVKETPIQTTSQSTSVRQDEGGSDDPLSGTTSVRGLDNSVVSTDFSGKSAADISKSMGNMSVNDRTTSVMNAMQEAKGYTGFAQGMQQFGAMAVPAVMANMMAGQKSMNPMDVLSQIGQPNANNLNAITSAFGYSPDMDDVVDATNFGTPAMEMEALSQAAYGKSLDAMSKQLGGVMPSFTFGYKPGDVDSSHGGTYSSNGQAVSAKGDVSYSSVNAFSNAMTAMGKSGYYGNEIQAKVDAKKGNKLAQNYITALNAVAAEQQNQKDKAAVKGRTDPTMNTQLGKFANINNPYGIGENTGPGSQGFGSETHDTSKGGTSTGTAKGTTATGMSTTAGGLGGGTGPGTTGPTGTGVTGVDDAPGDNSSSAESDAGAEASGAYKGSLITKRKASGKLKKKYMKRGGLASRK